MSLIATGSSLMLSTQDASHGAGHTRPVTSGKLFVEWSEVIAALKIPTVNVVVPVGDEVSERAPGVAERNAAIHAARALHLELVPEDGQLELAIVLHPLGGGPLLRLLPRVLHEAGDFSHGTA